MSERSTTNKKRKRPSSFSNWRDQPAFLDASATVSAATFGARRLPEIKALWNGVQAQLSNSKQPSQEYVSSGGKTSSRHLRRRTTSHLPRRRHRYPKGKPPAPGTNNTDENNDDETAAVTASKRPCRRARRKPVLLRQQHEQWQYCCSSAQSSSDDTADERVVAVVYWLTTHLWHAKRFQVHDNFFGWKVPLVHANRGARAALRMAAEHYSLIQDVTWQRRPILIGSSDLKTLVRAVQRFCPNLLSSSSSSSSSSAEYSPNAILSGCCLGQGVLYELDQFPIGAIGPAVWWMCGQQQQSPLNHDSSLRKTSKSSWWLCMFVHPAIRTTIRKIVLDLSNELSSLEGPLDWHGGIASFQLRGTNATASLKRALGPITSRPIDSGCTFDWDKTHTLDDLPTRLRHLTAIPVQVCLEQTAVASASDEASKIDDDTGLAYIDSFNDRVCRWVPTTMRTSPSACTIGNRTIILVSQCPNDPSLPHNMAVTGWDILCRPSEANGIFQALVDAGNARAIGVVEESLLRMDSEPPLPVFPQDFPDTTSGQSYWSGDPNDWQLVRHSLEQGWGRVHVVKTKKRRSAGNGTFTLPTVSWGHISSLPQDASSSGAAAVVVRGDFGKPFLDALAGCGHIPNTCSASRSGRTRRRPRRRVRPPSQPVSLCRLSMEDSDAHQNTCEALLESLSLPAIIRCHVKVEGKGTLESSVKILASMRDLEEQRGYIDYLLGVTVAGSFSMRRGLVHGVGFVGAARILHVLSSDHGRSSCVAVTRPDGTRHAELKVLLQASNRECTVRAGTVSLLL